MYFSHDPTHGFYYMGDDSPSGHIYTDHLLTPHTISADVETISLKERIAIGIGIATSPTCAFYFQLFPPFLFSRDGEQ